MAKKMLIDATHLEETRVVVADGNKVDEFDFESINKRQLAGNIYLAKVTRVEPSLQAAFVDYGGNRHGFLAFPEIHPDYYQIPVADREALLAEDAAEQARSAAGEDNGEAVEEKEKSRSRSRRGKRRARGKQAEAPSESGEVKGLEVIELSEEAAGADDAAAPAETPAPEVKGVEVKGLEIADLPGDDAEPAEAEAEGPDTTPKSIAESAGLDDDDSVSEDILDAAPKPSEAEEEAKPKAKPARKRVTKPARKKTPPAPADEAAEEAGPEKTDTEETSPEETVAEKAAAGADGVTADEAAPGDTAEDAPAGDDIAETPGETPDQPAAGKAKKPARSRKRRSRVQDEDEGEEATVEPAEAVESIGPDDTQEEAAKVRAKRRRHYKIQDVVKVRQIMLVQVVKEERGNKGAALTTYLSLAGRYCVLMPNTARGGGISRKITSAGDRKRLRDITGELEVPAGMGLIVRTAGAERTRAEIKRDYEFLLRQWEQIRELTLKSIAPTLIYEEGSLIKRSIRDLYSKEIDAILVEGEEGYREAKDYMKMLMPSHAKHVQQYNEQIPLFIRYQVENYLNAMFNPVVQLRSGGYIVIGITEALVAIDVNSGRSTKEASIEETALKTNLEAADEVARQLRLRDPRGSDRDRLHRHGRKSQQPRRRETDEGPAQIRPRPHPGRPHLRLRDDGDVAPAAAPGHAGGHHPAVPALPGPGHRPLGREPVAVDPARGRGRRRARPLGRGHGDHAGQHRQLHHEHEAGASERYRAALRDGNHDPRRSAADQPGIPHRPVEDPLAPDRRAGGGDHRRDGCCGVFAGGRRGRARERPRREARREVRRRGRRPVAAPPWQARRPAPPPRRGRER